MNIKIKYRAPNGVERIWPEKPKSSIASHRVIQKINFLCFLYPIIHWRFRRFRKGGRWYIRLVAYWGEEKESNKCIRWVDIDFKGFKESLLWTETRYPYILLKRIADIQLPRLLFTPSPDEIIKCRPGLNAGQPCLLVPPGSLELLYADAILYERGKNGRDYYEC